MIRPLLVLALLLYAFDAWGAASRISTTFRSGSPMVACCLDDDADADCDSNNLQTFITSDGETGESCEAGDWVGPIECSGYRAVQVVGQNGGAAGADTTAIPYNCVDPYGTLESQLTTTSPASIIGCVDIAAKFSTSPVTPGDTQASFWTQAGAFNKIVLLLGCTAGCDRSRWTVQCVPAR